MSTFEKIASIVIGIVVIVMVLFSFREIQEPEHHVGDMLNRITSSFDRSVGKDFQIGSFASTTSVTVSGGMESNCETMKPSLIASLHDIKERLEHMGQWPGDGDAFEVSESVLQTFCNKEVKIVLVDGHGDKLLLEKVPFTRAVPPGGSAQDIGTDVRINATVITAGAATSTTPTVVGEELTPDRFLDPARTLGN